MSLSEIQILPNRAGLAPVEKQAALEEPDRAMVLEQGWLDQPGAVEKRQALDTTPTEEKLFFQVWWNFHLEGDCHCNKEPTRGIAT